MSFDSRVWFLGEVVNVYFPDWMVILRTIIWSPYWLTHEQSHGLNIVGHIQGESMIYACRQNYQVSFLNPYTNPSVILVSYIKVSTAFQAEANLFISVNMLLEEALEFVMVVRKLLWAASNCVRVSIPSILTDPLEFFIRLVVISIQVPV
eukprot:Gb_10342 [translate_table: standard]